MYQPVQKQIKTFVKPVFSRDQDLNNSKNASESHTGVCFLDLSIKRKSGLMFQAPDLLPSTWGLSQHAEGLSSV